VRVPGSPNAGHHHLAADRIVARRTKAGDDGLEALSDDPLEVVGYVCARSGGVPPSVVADDVLDALRIITILRRTLDRRELSLLLMGSQVGLSWKQRAEALGLSSRQAAEQRALRLQQAAGVDGTRSEVTARAERRTRIAEDRWLATHWEAIENLARHLALLDLTSEDACDSVEAIAEELADRRPNQRLILAYTSQLLREIPESEEESAVPADVYQRARELAAAWRRVGSPR
jgi:hypothetical protein